MLSQIQETCSTLYHTGSPLYHIWKVKDATCTCAAGKVGLSHIRTRVKMCKYSLFESKTTQEDLLDESDENPSLACPPDACTYFA